MPRTLVIVNPHSGGGATRRRWRALEPRVRDALGALEVEHTRVARDAERLAREAVRAGIERLVVAGGDGTLAEVATGLLRGRLADYAEIAVLPMGTGCDFARTLGVSRDPESAIALLRDGKARRIDAGHARYVRRDGAPADSWFLNAASFGVSGRVVELERRGPRRLGGTVAFAIATVRALLRYRSARVALRVDGELVLDGPVALGVAANGRQFGGGMPIAPDARPDDGWLDVVCVATTSGLQLIPKLPKLYRGIHLADPVVHARRGRRIEADAAPGAVPLELDGDPVGALPAQIELVPGALSVIGPA
ncbi:MAG TPA: diacylglycerol kinase family protein [Myxococcota bacterium]|nr:diacylglycerol kinase family protein [Myxococcota bacterium]